MFGFINRRGRGYDPKDPNSYGQSWLGRVRSRRRETAAVDAVVHPVTTMMQHAHPFIALQALMRDMRGRILLGLTVTGWAFSDLLRNVGIFGAPRSNKTSSVAIPAIAAHPGPVIIFSSKRTEIAHAIGQMRALVAGKNGYLGFIGLDGSPAPKGWTQLGWTPWSKNSRLRAAIIRGLTSRMNQSGNGFFWASSAGQLLSALFLVVVHDPKQEKGMEWVLSMVKGWQPENVDEAKEILLNVGSREARIAVATLQREMDPETQANLLATASALLAPYESDAVLSVTERKRVSFLEVIKGLPDLVNAWLYDEETDTYGGGVYPTILITASSEQLKVLGNLNTGILGEIIHVAFRLHDDDEAAAAIHGRPKFPRQPLMIVVDDAPLLAGHEDLPVILAQSGGQSVLIVSTYHDDAQNLAVWGQEGANMATTYGEQIVFPGVRDISTLQRLSMLTGEATVYDSTTNRGMSPGGFTYGENTTPSRLPKLGPAEINQGHPTTDVVLSYHPDSWEWMHSTPYYSNPFWLKVMVRTMCFIAALEEPSWVHRLACPELDRDGGATLAGVGLLQEYRAAKAVIAEKAKLYDGGDDGGAQVIELPQQPPDDDPEAALVPA